MINMVIDGKKVKVSRDSTVLEAAKQVGIDIPALCYDKNLEIVAACRLCVVEIDGKNKLETSCSTKVREGMNVNTHSEKIDTVRKDVLQLLLDSHPNDCLTCQKAGECLLQKYAYEYDVNFVKHDGAMRPHLVDTSSPYILKDDSKCILCGKCVRTCSEVAERQVLAFADRGYDTRIVLDADQTLETSSCVSCNRCVTVCPVGALIDKRTLGKVRSWEGEKQVVKCKSCQYGCNFEVIKNRGKNIAVKAMEPTEGRPLCLRGRLTTEFINVDKPEKPFRKIDGKFEETSWTKALGLEEVMEKMELLKEDE
ncbi:NADPH-Fe(3+) oxidoreductase subunit alpha [Tissierella creatinophila DSM 6911]|uniref:NADPH-Fe(3+) oxidoreductase subunit alpha n=2 Tax=Tissierella creatinophila TaxID=79681 RepID=A0A1U7M8Y4_TISCR|nr:2Fe-2S iron-sulfur cluster-binding protein [Tissierella creatinophila]OLS03745.1 NADPH-Fe(3+) oxidoreductase subunit alpha [Tissierella creatinophila DSM 6911]